MVRSSNFLIASAVTAAALVLTGALMKPSGAPAAEERYPNFKGQWTVILTPGVPGQAVKFDPTKPWGRGQEAPLTPDYQKVHEASMADQAEGGLGNYPTATCHPGGMP